jgi:hypothetical protein
MIAFPGRIGETCILKEVVQLETMDNSRNAEPPARNLGNRAAPRQKLPPDKAKSSATLPLGI